ncbi:leucine-rich repeat-containing protein 56 [Spea bombifrons]|uniref:leucine-rich repeat-containing protein 56 n=1 Tax=Spea bombifrons TaxID=233779 RepID=UPI00234BDE28|nr:leucine-rich repeat-containing protein 56 [Spea bombifrons]
MPAMSHMDRTLDVRPSTGSVRITDFGWQGLLNPSPLTQEDDESLVDEYLSPAKLQALTGLEDLTKLKTLQMCVDTRDHTLGNFGTYMPNLRELKLNNSLIVSIRDLGTSLSKLEVLWMARCGLTDLDGISSLCSLKELYLAYNDLSELSQLSMLENLEILDLEGNNLDHISELQYPAMCTKLTTLTLEGNPICTQPNSEGSESADYNYRSTVKNMIPHLKLLDDVPADQLNPTSPRTPSHDWQMVKDYIKDNVGRQVNAALGLGTTQKNTNARPSTAQPTLLRRPFSTARPTSAGRPATSFQGSGRDPLAEHTEDGTAEDEASDLTHGVGRVLCGNPIKALRARKAKLGPLGNKPKNTCEPDVALDKDRDDVFAELRAWREKHNVLLQRIQEQRAPQVLTINHSDEEGSHSICSSSDDELSEPWDLGCLVRVTPEISSPSSQSLTGCLNPEEMPLQDAHCVPSPPITPCPPESFNHRQNKRSDIRARRFRKEANQSGTNTTRKMTASACVGDEAFPLTEFEGNYLKIQADPKSHEEKNKELNRRIFYRPPNDRSSRDSNSPNRPPSHQPVIRSSTKTPEKPSPPRAITTKETLQRLPNRPVILPRNKNI